MPTSAAEIAPGKEAERTPLDLRSPTFAREFRKAAREFTARVTATPEAARAQLVKEGILTKSGKLSKNYR